MSARPRSVDPPILLVEDRDSLRAMLRLALEAQGSDAEDAVAALANLMLAESPEHRNHDG